MKTLKKNNISQGSSINSPVPVNKNCDLPPFFNPDYFAHVVVQTLEELESIPCKLRQDGMVATVVQEDYSDYQLQTSRTGFGICDNNAWVKISIGDEVFNGGNLFLFQTEEQANEFMGSTQSKEGQIIYISDLDRYFKFDGQDGLTDAFPNKLDKPTVQGLDNPNYKIPAYLDGKPYWRSSSDFEKVKSVNSKTGDVILKTSDLKNDSDYTTNATLTVHTSNKSNPHNVTKSQIGLGNVDNTSDLNKPISTATQNTLDKKIDKPTANNTNQFVILGDGSTAPKSDFGKVDKVMGVAPDANKNVDISGVAMNWTNASQKMSALVSKHNDATYNRLLGMDANGNLNEVGLPAMTNEMSKATDAQKDAWRVASRKSGETYSIGQPRVDSIAPFILINDSEMHSLTLIGENLFINNVDLVSRVDIIDSRTNVIVETCESIAVHQTLPSRLSIDITKNLYDINVPYYTKVTHNGIQSIINTNAYFIIKETYFQTTDTLNWRLITPDGQDNSGITFSSNNPNNFSVTKTRDGKLNIVSDYEFDYNKNYYLNLNISTHFPNGEQFVTYFNHTYLTVIDSDRVKGLYQDYSNNIILYGGVAGYREQARVFNPTVGVGNSKTHNVELYINKGICRIVNVTEGINAVIILPISSSGKYKLFLYSTIISTQSSAAKTSTISVDVSSFSIQ